MIDRLTLVLLIYATGVLTTFGHILRTGHRSGTGAIKGAVWSAMWPAYWLVVHGWSGTFRYAAGSVTAATGGLSQCALRVYEFGMWMMPAFYLYRYWPASGDKLDYAVVLLKSLLWAPFWPAFALAYLTP